MAKNRFLYILARFYTLKMARNWNGLPPIVYGSKNLKNFSGVPNTSLQLPCEEESPNQNFCFLSTLVIMRFVGEWQWIIAIDNGCIVCCGDGGDATGDDGFEWTCGQIISLQSNQEPPPACLLGLYTTSLIWSVLFCWPETKRLKSLTETYPNIQNRCQCQNCTITQEKLVWCLQNSTMMPPLNWKRHMSCWGSTSKYVE